ncbi:MAG: hypothetical protein HRU23_09290 [Gammaproteobacteria bacterium]|nr:hypothetical protein [Gammaproteobacteria bacterium]
MEIQSAFNAGIAGYQQATELATESATNIANRSSNNASTADTEQAAQSVSQLDSRPKTSATEDIVNLRVAEHQALASATVISTADEVVGSLIDTRV